MNPTPPIQDANQIACVICGLDWLLECAGHDDQLVAGDQS